MSGGGRAGAPRPPIGLWRQPPACRVSRASRSHRGAETSTVSSVSATAHAIPEISRLQELAPVRPGAAIASVAAHLPATVVSNAEIAERIGVSDDWIVRRTGIRSRHIAAPHERLTAHAALAAALALDRAGIAPEDVDLVLVATTT